ncbi:hypothetical protein [Microbacterium sediminis]|uniref:Uncharacterized protein n=1 Tax=Microbacterium sediminis TaxID=904291 RepID=A0A1B9NA83_9MICO|nr:hypothetical protein [Microbacterium sediminis]OCG73496.1 hypothetical protein A7J15_07360 [Microbacterium sediminis]QBR73164.1 hypothetical protein E3O41_01075 [Microbacterium sediminis]
MSTDSRRATRLRSGRRRFAVAFVAVVGALAVLVGGGSAVSLLQGPRLSDAQVDPAAAIDVAGSRVILTANQALAEIDPSQVTVEPAAAHTVEAAGRGIGIRFTAPLDAETEYRVRVADVRGIGGGPATTLETSFVTPVAQVLMLERSEQGDDTIYRESLDGERVAVLSHPEIDDFRATSDAIVVSVREDGHARLIVTDRDGSDPRDVTLPGDGIVTSLQVSERGGTIGYTYSDIPDANGDAGMQSVLHLSSLRDPSAEPTPIEVGGEAPSVDRWRFVPDSSALLMIDFDGELILVEPDGAEPAFLGNALTIDAVTRGTYTAIVERIDAGVVSLDLATGEEQPIVEPDPSPGQLAFVAPLPDGDTVRRYTLLGDDGLPTGAAIAHVTADGEARTLTEVSAPDVLQQVCVSPSGQYAAAVVAPNLVGNPYDSGAQPVPQTLETRIVEVATGDEVATFDGFDISWCAVGPW